MARDYNEKYKQEFQKLIGRYESKGYITYDFVFSLAMDLQEHLGKGEKLVKRGALIQAAALVQAGIHEMVALFEYCDDDGIIGDALYDAIDLLREISLDPRADSLLREQIFSWLEIRLKEEVYFDYGGYGYRLFEVMEGLVSNDLLAERCLGYIDQELSRTDNRHYEQDKALFKASQSRLLALEFKD